MAQEVQLSTGGAGGGGGGGGGRTRSLLLIQQFLPIHFVFGKAISWSVVTSVC